MDGFLFEPTEYTDERIRAVMDGHACRQCGHRQTSRQGYEGRNRVQICAVRKSNRSKSGQLRISYDQPACILFTHKNHAK